MNLLLKNCKIIVNGKEFLKQISVVNGKIESITSNDINIIPDAKTRTIDVKENFVLPGLIDAHVHFREPGMENKENLFTGSKAAVKGGVTTFFDMPNTDPATITLENLNAKRELASKSIANYGFHFGTSQENNIEEIKKVTNVPSTKVFLDVSTGKMIISDDELLKDIFRNSRKVSVHAEGDNVKKAIKYNKDYGHGLYICHVSTKKEIEEIKKSKENEELNNSKHPIHAEVSPHHLFLTEKDESKIIKMKPGLKTQQDVDSLWDAINEGIIDTIGSDHAPHQLDEKQKNDLYGVPGVETILPLMLNAVNEKKITLQKIIELCCINPAKFFGVNNKGELKEDYDADMVIVDMNLNKEITNEGIVSKCKWSPFSGKMIKGWPIMTIIRGNVVFENDKINCSIMGREVEFK